MEKRKYSKSNGEEFPKIKGKICALHYLSCTTVVCYLLKRVDQERKRHGIQEIRVSYQERSKRDS